MFVALQSWAPVGPSAHSHPVPAVPWRKASAGPSCLGSRSTSVPQPEHRAAGTPQPGALLLFLAGLREPARPQPPHWPSGSNQNGAALYLVPKNPAQVSGKGAAAGWGRGQSQLRCHPAAGTKMQSRTYPWPLQSHVSPSASWACRADCKFVLHFGTGGQAGLGEAQHSALCTSLLALALWTWKARVQSDKGWDPDVQQQGVFWLSKATSCLFPAAVEGWMSGITSPSQTNHYGFTVLRFIG